MPFQYFHIMSLMLLLNLLLWAYSLALQDSYFAPFIYIFVQMMFQGIRELATSLSNPFGIDDVDFPLQDWIEKAYTTVYLILQSVDAAELKDPKLESRRMQRPAHAGRVINVNIDVDAAE